MAFYSTKLLLLILTNVYTTNAQSEGAVQLLRGPTTNCGRVEVFHNRQWGTVCDDRWNLAAGNIVCQQLNYTNAQTVYDTARFGRGKGPIWIDGIRCTSRSASFISECEHNGWGIHDCTHAEDAGVCCQRKAAPKPRALPVRLRCPECDEEGGAQRCNSCPNKRHPSLSDCLPQVAVRGIVEVFVNDKWGPISAEGWGVNEATVVCGELGYPMAYPYGHIPPRVEEVWLGYSSGAPGEAQCSDDEREQTSKLYASLDITNLQGVDCSGSESTLLNCYFADISSQPNPTRSVATVQCGFFPNDHCYKMMSETYRLRGGAVPWMGRVEVKMSGEWGTVCDTGFDTKEANIVCRRLGYGTAKKVKGRAGYGRGVGKIHLTQLICDGSEMKLGSCEHTTGRAAQSCGHEGDVGIECHVPDMSQCIEKSVTYQVRMHKARDSQNTAVTRSYPEVLGGAGWGMLCYSEKPMVTTLVGEVICRQSEQLFLSKISRGDRPSEYSGHVYYSGEVNCTGDEELLSDCSIDVSPSGWCPEKYTIVDCTPTVPDLVPDLYRFRRSLQARYWVDRLPLYYLSCAKEEGCLSSSAEGADYSNQRYLLRFDSLTMNYGLHDFLPVLPKEDWLWHSCHNHYHSMETFVEYDLLNTATGEKVAEGHKASFCLEDSTCARGTNTYFRCYLGNQGISVNCGDLYGNYLDCQWIDITGVAGGEYIVRQRVNPQRLVVESDYKNNEIACKISLQSNRYSYITSDCWLSDHEATIATQH